MLLFIYRCLWWFILPWVLLFRYFKDKKSGYGFSYGIERLGFSPSTHQHDIILHAVSLGEVRAMMPLVFEVQKKFPQHSILITTTTLTGRAQIQQSFGDTVSIAFLPHDIGFFIHRFLKKVQPKVFMIMETEIWPNLFLSAQKLAIPTYIISACLSQRSQKGYSKIPKTIHKLLSHVTIMAQTEEDAERFHQIGASHVSVMGNLKYLTRLPEDFIIKTRQLVAGKRNYLLWCLASSHDQEEKIVLEVFKHLNQKFPHIKLAIAPRHPERFGVVEGLLKDYGYSYQKRSETDFKDFSLDQNDVWLFDSIGELLYLYGASDLVTVAGSFVPIGGHNILEPAFLGKAVTTGPYIDNIKSMVRLFQENEALVVSSTSDLAQDIEILITQRELRETMGNHAYQCVMQEQQALSKVIEAVEKHLKE